MTDSTDPRLASTGSRLLKRTADLEPVVRYGMVHKTTVYLSDELKAAVESEARRRGLSEGEVIRQAIAETVRRPRPQAAIIDGEAFAERAEELLPGFGER